ncbi:MAG: 4Fe-4S binding protein [Peptococcaceae bacterium]|nr:4Fe-4S binding protein [Peptococcaceae bacterium]
MSPRKIVLRFNTSISDKPIISRLVKDYDLEVNIIKANVNPLKEGTMVLEITGEKLDKGIKYLRDLGVQVEALTQDIIRDEDKCVMCGACTAICPTGALYIERPSMEVKFNSDNCVVCLLCVKICPFKAMEVKI